MGRHPPARIDAWLRELSSAAASSSSSVGGAPNSSGGDHDNDDERSTSERRALREMLGTIRASFCTMPDRVAQEQRAYAFSPREVRSIVEAAATAQERLVILLFLTTGLRIGGLCRLQVPEGPLRQPRQPPAPHEVPTEWTTVEKNGRPRRVRLCDSCRILIARWYNSHCRADGGGLYLFPGKRGGDGATSPRHIWDVCSRVFARAGITGPHVHPHTFRHTVVHMLYMQGMSFDRIAKCKHVYVPVFPRTHIGAWQSWIGHAHPSVTSGVYGRLSQEDIHGLMGGAFPFSEEGSSGPSEDVRAEWGRVARFINRPYVFDDAECIGLVPTSPPPIQSTSLCATVRQVLREELQGVLQGRRSFQ